MQETAEETSVYKKYSGEIRLGDTHLSRPEQMFHLLGPERYIIEVSFTTAHTSISRGLISMCRVQEYESELPGDDAGYSCIPLIRGRSALLNNSLGIASINSFGTVERVRLRTRRLVGLSLQPRSAIVE